MTPRRHIALLAVLASLVMAASASATSYCVAPNTTCGGTNVADFQGALDQAAAFPNNDRIFLGAATYMAPAHGFHYTTAYPLDIVGAGAGKTILTAPAGNDDATLLATGGGINISDMTVMLPMNVAGGYHGLETDAWVENVRVSENPTQSNYHTGVDLKGYGTLRSSSVTLAEGPANTTGVQLENGQPSLWNSSVSARTAVDAGMTGSTATIGRSRLAGKVGIETSQGTTNVSQTLIRFDDQNGLGVGAGDQSTGDTVVHLDGVVIQGPGQVAYGAINAGTELYPDRNVDISVDNSIIRGASIPLVAYAPGSGHAAIDVSYSDLDPAGDKTTGAQASIALAHMLNTGNAAGFVDAASGDFHLRTDSPLIDAGDPAAAVGAGDLDGNPLNTDGDGDGIGRRDIGAYESPAVPPKPATPVDPGTPAEPTVAGSDAPPPAAARDNTPPVLSRLARVKARFRYRLSEPASVRIQIQRRGAHGRWRTTRTVVRAGRAGANSTRLKITGSGRFRALVRATDASGNRSALRRLGFVAG